MPKVLVPYHSSHGHTGTTAHAVAEGARSAGAEVAVRRAPETVLTGGDGSRRPSVNEPDGARAPGRHAAETAAKVAA